MLKDETPLYGSEDDIIDIFNKTVLKDETPLYGSEDDIINIYFIKLHMLKDETLYGSEDNIVSIFPKTVLKDETLYGSEDDFLFTGWERAGYNWQGWDLAVILINMVHLHDFPLLITRLELRFYRQ